MKPIIFEEYQRGKIKIIFTFSQPIDLRDSIYTTADLGENIALNVIKKIEKLSVQKNSTVPLIYDILKSTIDRNKFILEVGIPKSMTQAILVVNIKDTSLIKGEVSQQKLSPQQQYS